MQLYENKHERVVDPPLREMFILFLGYNRFLYESRCFIIYHLLYYCMYIYIFLVSSQFDLSQLHKCTFSLILNGSRGRGGGVQI